MDINDIELNVHAEQIKTLFRKIYSNFRTMMQSKVAEYGFTVPQFSLLMEVYRSPDITLIELSNKMGLAKSTVSGIVDRLEKQGVVLRTRATEDRRTVRISLAPKMAEIQEELQTIKNNYLTDVLKDVDQKEILDIISSLAKLNALMETHKQ